MKNYTLILLLAAMMIACQHNRTRNSIETFTVEEEVFASDTIGLIVQSDNAVLEELTEISPHIAYVESEVERWIGEDDSTLKSTDEIDATLTAMFNKYYENDYESDYEKDEGRSQTQPNSDAASLAEATIVKDSCEDESYIAYPYMYKEHINGYKVRGEIKVYDSAEHIYSEDTLFFTNIKSGKSFSIHNSIYRNFISKADLEDTEREYTPHSTDTDGIITAPYEDFFFADLDFDGQEELIAGVLPQGASQRGVGLFTDIYKIIDGDVVNYTKYFLANSDIFNHIEQYFFTVNTNTRSIMLYSSGGAYNGGWDIYDYKDGDYVYRHYVSVEWDREDKNIIQVSIYPNSEDRVKGQNLIKQFTTTQEEYDKHRWGY